MPGFVSAVYRYLSGSGCVVGLQPADPETAKKFGKGTLPLGDEFMARRPELHNGNSLKALLRKSILRHHGRSQ